jgi:hypothetical protein
MLPLMWRHETASLRHQDQSKPPPRRSSIPILKSTDVRRLTWGQKLPSCSTAADYIWNVGAYQAYPSWSAMKPRNGAPALHPGPKKGPSVSRFLIFSKHGAGGRL